MTWLEGKYRARFRAQDGGYVFMRRGVEVPFSAAEVESLVEQWRDLWLAPWLWGGWLLIGIVGPIWLARNDYEGGAWTLGVLAAGFMVAVLSPVLTKPAELADTRLPDTGVEGIGYRRTPPWMQIGFFGLITFLSAMQAVEKSDLSAAGRACLWGAMFVAVLSQANRKDDKPNLWETLAMFVGGVAGLAFLLLNPHRDGFDLALAGVIGAVVIALGVGLLWKRLRQSS